MVLKCYGHFLFDETSLVMKRVLVVIMSADEMSSNPHLSLLWWVNEWEHC